MPLFRRHDRKPGQSHHQVPERGPVSMEAIEALRTAEKAQRDAQQRATELAPLITSIRKHLDENEIAATIGANYARRRAAT
jgi:hypothetical protein